MRMGWSDGGYGGLRASDADRKAVLRLLRVAEREGRLDAAEYDRRLRAVLDAGARADLAALTGDLPARRGERDWVDEARFRTEDRDLAAGVLAEGTAGGRLSTREYEQRVVALEAAVTYAQLSLVLDGLPGWPGAPDAYHSRSQAPAGERHLGL